MGGEIHRAHTGSENTVSCEWGAGSRKRGVRSKERGGKKYCKMQIGD